MDGRLVTNLLGPVGDDLGVPEDERLTMGEVQEAGVGYYLGQQAGNRCVRNVARRDRAGETVDGNRLRAWNYGDVD